MQTPGKYSYCFIATLCFALAAALFFGGMPITAKAGPGDLDLTFGTGGRIPPPSGLPTNSTAFGVAVQPDQKILVASSEQNLPFQTPSVLASLVLTRYLPNGSPDLTFGVGGSVVSALSEQCPSYGNDLALQDDGKIVVTGHLDGCGQERGAYVLRFLPDGSPDPTFDGDGKLRILGLPGFYNASCTLAIQRDGKLVLSCGGLTIDHDKWTVILRLDPNGSIDTTFGEKAGIVWVEDSSEISIPIAIQPDGNIVAATPIDLAPLRRGIMLTRLKSAGWFDTSFGNGGQVITSGGEFTLQAWAIALQPDNKIVIAGYWVSQNTVNGLLIRYLPNGSLDTSFGASGIVFSDYPSNYSSIAIQSNGKIVAGGWSPNGHILARFLSNGAPDQTFGTNGHVSTVFPNLSQIGIIVGGILDLAIQSDGKIIGAGDWTARQTEYPLLNYWSYPAIARYIGDSAATDVSISGRVTTANGRGLGNAVVSMTDSLGVRRTATTSTFGYYSFNNIPGDTYNIAIRSKRYAFEPRTVFVDENLSGLDFVALK